MFHDLDPEETPPGAGWLVAFVLTVLLMVGAGVVVVCG